MIDGVYPADRAHLERILGEARQLERLIDDLRTLAMAEAGSLVLQREATDLGILAADVVAGFEPDAVAGGIELAVEAETDVPVLELDPRRIRQVLANLVSNALRHTPRDGRVTVTLRLGGDAVLLEVADTGLGMDVDAASHAFERFWRSADSPGAGLGLPIVRDLVEAHGGTVELVSTPGVGTTVRCRFPAPGG